jgi:hypothetical protein
MVDGEERGVTEIIGEPVVFMARCLERGVEEGVFILDGAATNHVVDEWVGMQHERPVHSVVRGVGNLPVTGAGVLNVQGLLSYRF